MQSLPSKRFFQNSFRSLAMGNRPLIPTTAIAGGVEGFGFAASVLINRERCLFGDGIASTLRSFGSTGLPVLMGTAKRDTNISRCSLSK